MTTKLQLKRARVFNAYCDGKKSLSPDEVIKLLDLLGITSARSLSREISRLRKKDSIHLKPVAIPYAETHRTMVKKGLIVEPEVEIVIDDTPYTERRPGYYQKRYEDNGNTDYECLRCKLLMSQKTTLTLDECGFIYCAACGWEPCWTEDGLPITAAV